MPIEDSTVPGITISSRVVAEVVGLVKNRQGDMPDRSVVPLAAAYRAPELPAPPKVGEHITISVSGGRVTLDIPDDQWAAYVAERNFYLNQEDDHDHGVIEPPDPPFTEPNPGTITRAHEPGLDVEVGHRYLLFLDDMISLSLEGATEFVWRHTFSYDLAQFEVDGEVRAFRAPHGEMVTPAELLEAAEAAVALDVAPAISTYHFESMPSLLGLVSAG